IERLRDKKDHKLRLQIASSIGGLVSTIHVAVKGSRELTEKLLPLLKASPKDAVEGLIEYLESDVADEEGSKLRFFTVMLKDGTSMSVYPNPDNPYEAAWGKSDDQLRLLEFAEVETQA